MNKRLIAILGPTSSGKSIMAIQLAKTLGDTAIVNCDSRQIYKHLNLGTGKVPGKWQNHRGQDLFVYQNQPHYLIDYVEPAEEYSLTKYLNDFYNLTQNLPQTNIILVGGTGMYADAIISNYLIPLLSPQQEKNFQSTKQKLEQLSTQELQKIFQEKKSQAKLNESDYHNPRRLINQTLKTDPRFQTNRFVPIPQFSSKLVFAIKVDQEILHQKIQTRLNQRFQEGLVDEVKKLKLNSQRLQNLGLEYRIVDNFLNNRIHRDEVLPKMLTKNYQYAKRQLTWLQKRNPIWVRSINDVTKALGI